jgi:hypothetical protein
MKKHRRMWIVSAFVLLLAVGAAGCSRHDDPAVATANSGAPKASAGAAANGEKSLLKFSQCMRDQGFTWFPDPQPDGGLVVHNRDGAVRIGVGIVRKSVVPHALRHLPYLGQILSGDRAPPAPSKERGKLLMGARRTAGVVAGVLTVGAVTAAIAVFNLPKAQSSPNSADNPPVSTAEITKQTLIDRESHDGTLAHGDTTTISSRGNGTVTGLPVEGATVSRGKALFHLDNKPVNLLYGSLPAYRPLLAGVKGADVKQFEQNLWALGYRGFTVDETYNTATASAVKTWQRKLGLIASSTVDPSQIVYAAGAVRVDSLSTQVGTVIGPGTAVERVTGTRPLGGWC